LVKTDIFLKVLLYLGTVISFVFGFLSYIIAIRPGVQTVMNDYSLGMLEGGLIVFVLTALPLTYAYLKEKKKKRKTRK
jgi:hypothetical protein